MHINQEPPPYGKQEKVAHHAKVILGAIKYLCYAQEGVTTGFIFRSMQNNLKILFTQNVLF